MTTNVNFLTWNDDQRRMSSYVVLGAAVVVALAALALWFFVDTTPDAVYWALVVLLAIVLVFMAVLLFVPVRTAAPAMTAGEASPEAAPASTGEASPEVAPAQAFVPRVLTLRCGDCGTIFEVTDTGERPLYHTCPGCGAEGALRDEPVAEAAPAPAQAAEPQPEPAPTTAPAAAPAWEPPAATPAAPPPPPPKKLKLRCGGCKEVFTIEDTGERPLRRACPHCGRMGQIN